MSKETKQYNITDVSETPLGKEQNIYARIDTRFHITKELIDMLNETTGVEHTAIHRRYHLFVSKGEMFEFSEVKKNISLTIDKFLE